MQHKYPWFKFSLYQLKWKIQIILKASKGSTQLFKDLGWGLQWEFLIQVHSD